MPRPTTALFDLIYRHTDQTINWERFDSHILVAARDESIKRLQDKNLSVESRKEIETIIAKINKLENQVDVQLSNDLIFIEGESDSSNIEIDGMPYYFQ